MKGIWKYMVALSMTLALVFAVGCSEPETPSVDSSAELAAVQEELENTKKELADARSMMESESGNRLEAVKERGKVICASRNDVPGYGSLDAAGNHVGFDIDLCRAVAAAVLATPTPLKSA